MNSMALVAIATTILLYLSYYLITHTEGILSYFKNNRSERNALIAPVVFQRLVGALLLGLGSVVVGLFLMDGTLTDFGVTDELSNSTLFWVSGCFVVVLILSWVVSRKPDNYKVYPHIRVQNWGGWLIIVNSVCWFLYLLGYEFMFRGFLLSACIPVLGVVWAIVVNTVLYALAHTPQGMRETIGSIPIGVMMCLITIHTGSFWAAFLIHIIISQSNDYISVYANPEMSFRKHIGQ